MLTPHNDWMASDIAIPLASRPAWERMVTPEVRNKLRQMIREILSQSHCKTRTLLRSAPPQTPNSDLSHPSVCDDERTSRCKQSLLLSTGNHSCMHFHLSQLVKPNWQVLPLLPGELALLLARLDFTLCSFCDAKQGGKD